MNKFEEKFEASLRAYYDNKFRIPGMSDFDALTDTEKLRIASTSDYALHQVNEARAEFKKALNKERNRFIKFMISLFKK